MISLEIKPTSHTGLLLSSSSTKGDYIVLEMIRGNVRITCPACSFVWPTENYLTNKEASAVLCSVVKHAGSG